MSLIQRKERGVYQFHQLLQEFFRKKSATADAEQMGGFVQAMLNLAKSIPQTVTLSDISKAAMMMPHLKEFVSVRFEELGDDEIIWPFVALSRFYAGQGLFREAEPWSTRAVAVCTERLREEHPDVARSINNLAALYHSQGRYEEAEPLYAQALEMSKKLLGEEHPTTKTIEGNLRSLREKKN